VENDSTLDRISAKRLVNFAWSTFVKAESVNFSVVVKEREDQGCNGRCEVIRFEWLDEKYQLFADTVSGIIDISNKRIKGKVVDKESKNEGSFDFWRVMANKMSSESSPVRAPTLRLEADTERTRAITHVLAIANKKADEDIKKMRGF